MHNIVSFFTLPGRRCFKAIGRAVRVLLNMTLDGWQTDSIACAFEDIRKGHQEALPRHLNDATTCMACQAPMTRPSTITADAGQAACVRCDAGSITGKGTDVGATSCVRCPAGYFSPVSTADQCTGCEAGMYINTAGAQEVSDCKPCAAGHFQVTPASVSCLACPTGKYDGIFLLWRYSP